ncbi:beta strand repeat-containing protein [Colwellia sp. 12G3]|uniref:beta strand repeat-containing protein n=1 Tax=Colwellia sp. 12G3 TaxID=2058299 RepID=UPI000C347F79|nr:Ig-like domain-containing protein [Colwellia sp. 12G3]PKI14264.1 hypothetical protein CXF71_17035 [Colwellia sp. 12G3]
MQLLRRISFTLLLMSMMTLVACGDGDGDLTGGDGGGDTPDAVTLTVTKSDGDLSAANDITVFATVLDNGSAVVNKTVTFTLAVEGSATFDPVAGTATTDANGIASITVKVTDMKGSVNVIATYESATDNISFDSAGDGDGDVSNLIKISIAKSEGDLSADNSIIISASYLSVSTGEGVEGELITFTLNDPAMATFDPAIGTAVTDASGVAQITVKVTDVAGGVEVTATVGKVTDSASTSIGFTSIGDGVKVIVGEPKAASINLFASTQQLASSGSQSIELTAIAKDVNNNLLEGVTIQFSPSSGELGNILDENGESSDVTGPDGKVIKKLSTQINPSNRIITVTVTSGDITDSLDIEVVGTTLTLTGSASLALNDAATYIINVLDSDGNGVAKTDVAISLSDTGTAEITIPTMVTTDSEGQATLGVTGTSGGTNTIIIAALGATASQNVSVQSDSFLFTSFSNGVDTINPSNTPVIPDVSLAQTATVTLTWQRDGVIVADGTAVTFTTTRGVLLGASSGTTVDGKVSISLTSTDAGKALVTFVGKDSVNGNAIELTNYLEFEFFADSAATIKAQASPNSIGPNEQTSTISVVVKDANGNLVKNKKIKFVLTDISGGAISPATAVTNSSGTASTIYTSNSTSAKDAVVITAIVEDDTDIFDTVNLTVSGRELFISLGTGNELEELGTTDYVKEYSVFVTDAESNAVENVALTVSAIPKSYYKGFWMPTFDGDEFVVWLASGVGSLPSMAVWNAPTKCSNEDVNFNGILDDGEDFNNDGELTPGNIVSVSGTFVTDADGRSVIRVIYPQSYAHWVDTKLIVSGKVTGSESSTQTIFTLPVLSAHVNTEKVIPPTQAIGTIGPFGMLADCALNIENEG